MIILLLLIALAIEIQFSPRVEYLEKESLLILFYGAKNTRKRKIFKL
jgi:hypothetical protein